MARYDIRLDIAYHGPATKKEIYDVLMAAVSNIEGLEAGNVNIEEESIDIYSVTEVTAQSEEAKDG